MSKTQTRQFDVNDVVTHPNGAWYQVSEIDGDTVTCSLQSNSRSRDFPVEEISEAVKDHGFTVYDGGSLDKIKGIGAATAPKIHAATECMTPSELVSAYLTDPETNVRDTMPRTDNLNEWLRDNIDSLDVNVSKAELQLFLFALEFDLSPKTSSALTDTENIDVSNRYSNVEVEKLTTKNITWEPGYVAVGSAKVAMLTYDFDGLFEMQDVEWWDELESNDLWEDEGEYFRFEKDGGITFVTAEHLEGLQKILTFDLNDVRCHPDGEYPVIVQDQQTDVWAAIAPRVE